jgi:Spx/MgsR family transcriptional regulator
LGRREVADPAVISLDSCGQTLGDPVFASNLLLLFATVGVSPVLIATDVSYSWLATQGTWHMPVTIYGIKNCDTMKKAFAWLTQHGIAYDFHDYKKAGASKAQLVKWCRASGWETVLNRAGPTFRKLPDAAKQDLNQEKAISLMLGNPSMIKRPIVEMGAALEIGFKPERYEALFKV